MVPPTERGRIAGRLRAAFLEAGYTADGVRAVLGPVAEAALHRGETVPARRATDDGSALSTLVRLFALQDTVPRPAADAALPVGDAVDAGFLATDADGVRALASVEPYAEPGGPPWWIVSDLAGGLDGAHRALRDDHVVGVGGASTMLAQLTIREPVGRTLDIGTGCGVQALHTSRHSRSVTATDVSPRALAMARWTVALSDVEVDLREGSFTDPVRNETFDLVVSNPPFVVAPHGRHTYRETGLPLDGVTAHLLTTAPRLLGDGGTLQILGNWVHRRGQPWEERVASWLPATGVRVHVVQREVQDPAAYVALWLRDSDEVGTAAYRDRYDEWLQLFEDSEVEAVGFGFVTVRRVDGPGSAEIVDWPHPVEQPLGPHVAADLARAGWLRDVDDRAFLAARLRLVPGVVQEQVGPPGAEDPEHVVLRSQTGFRRAVRSDTATAAFAGACDGRLPVAALAEAVLDVLATDDGHRPAARDALLDGVRALVGAGILEPDRASPAS